MKAKILDPDFKYVCAVATDIQQTWRKFGWRPLNEMSNMRSVDTSKTDSPERRGSDQSEGVRQ